MIIHVNFTYNLMNSYEEVSNHFQTSYQILLNDNNIGTETLHWNIQNIYLYWYQNKIE